MAQTWNNVYLLISRMFCKLTVVAFADLSEPPSQTHSETMTVVKNSTVTQNLTLTLNLTLHRTMTLTLALTQALTITLQSDLISYIFVQS